jgi:hypothetical protein
MSQPREADQWAIHEPSDDHILKLLFSTLVELWLQSTPASLFTPVNSQSSAGSHEQLPVLSPVYTALLVAFVQRILIT